MLSQNEGNAKPIIDALIAGKRLTHPERADLSYFLAFLFFRTPKFEREVTQIADAAHKQIAKEGIPSVEAAAKLLAKQGKESSPDAAQGFYDFIHQERFRISGHRNITLELMIEQAKNAAKGLFLMSWEVVRAPAKRSYVTSDSPLGYIVPEHLRATDRPVLGLVSEEITKVIPLAAGIALRIGGYGMGLSHVEASRQELVEINLAIARECDRFLIGPNEDQVRNVVERSQIDTLKTGTQLKVESVTHPTDPKRSFLVTHRVAPENADRPFNPQNLMGVR